MTQPRSILLLCPDVITERMAGPAIRYWEFAKTLSQQFRVTLAATNLIPSGLTLPHVAFAQHTPENIDALVAEHDIIVFQGYILEIYHTLRYTHKILIADVYDPIPLEGLEQLKQINTPEAHQQIAEQVRMMNTQLKYADYFLCANSRQRDLWLGHLLSLGRITPSTYHEMQQRVCSVPFGLPDIPPQATGDGLRTQHHFDSEFVLLWGGGIWEWFDPLSLIKATHQLLPRYPDLRLVFLGTKHPNPSINAMPMQHRAETLAKELGVYGKEVLFQAGWVPYEALANYLLDSDVGVTAHFETLETHFSFRTRILHYLWAGKPIITTTGDVLAEAITEYKAGVVVDYNDQQGWVEAITRLRDPEYYAQCVAGVERLAQHYKWSTVTQALQALCADAQLAPDIRIIEQRRQSPVWECEQAHRELRDYITQIENSHSWKLTAPLRNFRRWLAKA